MTKISSLAILFFVVLALVAGCNDSPQQSDTVVAAPNASIDASASVQTEQAQKPSPTAKEVETLYNQSCISCHSSGIANAPKAHDVPAWQTRLAKGMSTLLDNTKQGINAMPPMGMCMQCSDQDFEALIVYMSSEKQ